MKRIKLTGKSQPLIRDTGPAQPLVARVTIRDALDAEEVGAVFTTGGVPSLAALRQELFRRLVSTGGRPALEGTARRQKVPLSDADWERLCELAQRLADGGPRPAPAQVASALLHLALENLDVAESSLRGQPIEDQHWTQGEAPHGAALLRFLSLVKRVLLIQDPVAPAPPEIIDDAACQRWLRRSGAPVGASAEEPR